METNKELFEDVINEVNIDGDVSELEQLRADYAEMADKYVRAMAEVENTRRRARVDVEQVSRNRAMGVAENFLPLIDAIDAAQKHSPNDDGIKTLVAAAGSVLASVGIVKIESVGQTLNPQFHNAVSVADTDAGTGTVVEEFQSGYMFGDTVLRPAMVIVAK